MKTQQTLKKAASSIVFFAAPLVIGGMLLNSADLAAENAPIPFAAMMQSASVQPATSAPGPKDASQPAPQAKITNGGKAEIAGGIVMVGAGVLTVIATALISNGFKPSGGKTGALYGGGAAVAAVGVTLIVVGRHRRSMK